MKTVIYSFIVGIFFLGFVGCSSSKISNGFVELKTPFSEPEYRTDKNTFRATGVETVEDEQSAKDGAYLSASSLITTQIKQQLTTFNNRFAQAVNKNQAKDYESLLNTYVNTYAKEIIGEIKYVSDKTFQKSIVVDNKTITEYKVYVHVEKSRDDIKVAYEKRLSADDKLKVMFDRKKYLDEMKKYEEEYQKN